MAEMADLREVFIVLKKHLLLIVCAVFCFVFLGGVVSYTVLTPQYEASTQLLVSQSSTYKQRLDLNQIQTNLGLIQTYQVMIKSPFILRTVIDKLHLKRSVGSLNKEILVDSEQGSQVIHIRVNDPDPRLVVRLTNTIASVFQHKIGTVMDVDNVSILSEAVPQKHPSPVKPNHILNLVVAFVLGAFMSIAFAFFLEFIDHTIKNENEASQVLGLNILGEVACIPIKRRRLLNQSHYSKGIEKGHVVES